MLKDKKEISKLNIIIFLAYSGIVTMLLVLSIIFNFTVQYGDFKITANGHDAWVIYSKTISIQDEKQKYEDDKKRQQIQSTKDIVKKIKTLANLTFKTEMIDRGIEGNIYENPIYKFYVHMFYYVVDIAEDDAIAKIVNDLETFVKKDHYDYDYYKTEFENFVHTPILILLNQVRENIQKEWIEIKDTETGIIITSQENYEYMEIIAMDMYLLIQSVFVEAFKIELKYDKLINDKDNELQAFLELLR